MKAFNFGQTVSLLANLGVIVGIVFLVFEMRQNSELMRVQINQARADAAMLSNEHSFNSEFIPAILAKIKEGNELSAEEWIRFVDYFRAMNRNQDNVLSQYDAGMLGENTPRSVTVFACVFVNATEQHSKAWEFTKRGYTDRYIEFIEKAIGDCN